MCMPGGSGSSGVRGCFLNTHPCLLARPGAVCPPEMLAREEEEAAAAGGRKRPPPAAAPGACITRPGAFPRRAGCVCRSPREADEVLMQALPAAFQPGSHQQTRMGGSEGLRPTAALLPAPAAYLQPAQIAAVVEKLPPAGGGQSGGRRQSFVGKSQKA